MRVRESESESERTGKRMCWNAQYPPGMQKDFRENLFTKVCFSDKTLNYSAALHTCKDTPPWCTQQLPGSKRRALSLRPSVILASLHTPTIGEEAAGRFSPPPKYGPGSDSKESYRPQPNYEDRHMEVDSTGSYDPYMEFHEGYTDYGE
ncbi:hypothetical protein P4O66_004374 [Electrophorus voltai]|uniref:Uncharacterized protein n=1 Tax=Electrophorus voltai TaxID=2609070 RepID=A0AAD8ZPL2_9TELE|nr:hypothetical protein P4O66_004374 [Electrophorus voltai]